MRHGSKRELPRSGIASKTKRVRDKMSKNESHGQPCDIISIGGGRNGKSIRERKKRRKNHNKKGEADSLGKGSIWRLKRLWHSHIMEEKQMEMKGIALHRVKIIMGG